MAQLRAGWLAGAVAVAALLGTAVTAHGATAHTAYTVSGTEVFHPPPHPEDLLPGYFADVEVNQIDYPAAILGMDRSVAVAAEAVLAAIDTAEGPLILAGYSQGAIALTYGKLVLMSRPADQRPAPDDLTFLTIGDPTGPGGIMRSLPFRVPVLGLSPVLVPETPYDTVLVTGEYDGWSDFPDRPWNLISLANALIGTAYVHGGYEMIPGGLDISDLPARNVSVATNSLGGQTTSYLIPTERLPLVQPLRDIGVPEPFVAGLEASLKPIVDAGYARHDDPAVDDVSLAQSARQSHSAGAGRPGRSPAMRAAAAPKSPAALASRSSRTRPSAAA